MLVTMRHTTHVLAILGSDVVVVDVFLVLDTFFFNPLLLPRPFFLAGSCCISLSTLDFACPVLFGELCITRSTPILSILLSDDALMLDVLNRLV